jgi:hypothetical protein
MGTGEMRELIRHLWHNNREHVLRSSYMNCHARGLHSIMLLDDPGKRIRLFVTDRSHKCWKADEAIGYHAHHCAITIQAVHGWLENIVVGDADGPVQLQELGRYEYTSPIVSGLTSGQFKRVGTTLFKGRKTELLRNSSVEMRASEIHTVRVPRKEIAAWLVYEGREDPNYKPITWSRTDLEHFDWTGMYRRMRELEAVALLSSVGVL